MTVVFPKPSSSSSPSGAAGGDLSGTYPNPAVAKVNGVAIPAAGAAAGTVPVATSAVAAAWTFPPGYEFGYAQITSNKVINGAGVSIVTVAITSDGAPILIEFFANSMQPGGAAAARVQIEAFDGATSLGVIWDASSDAGGNAFSGVYGAVRTTLSAGAHTVGIQGTRVGGTSSSVIAGAGGASTAVAAYVRATKV